MKNLSKTISVILFVAAISLESINAQVAINTDGSSPESSAILDVKSTNMGFLPPRMTTVQRDAISTPVDGLIIFNTSTKCLEFYYYGYWYQTYGTPDVETITNPTTGRIWLDRNIGASQVATNSTDAAAYGYLYQWGRSAEGHEIRTSTTTSTNATTAVADMGNQWDGKFITEGNSPHDWLIPQQNELWQELSPTNNPCPTGYRIPTEAEWLAERLTWASNDAAGAFASVLKLPVGGYRSRVSGSLYSVGSNGYYWSSTVSGTNASRLHISSSSASNSDGNRALGFSIRCIKEYEVLTVYNHVTGKTWMDRNVGATRVATSFNDIAAYGNLYQWGRASEGHENRISTTSLINAYTAVPNQGNPWDGKFVTEEYLPYDWLSPQDNTLWQGIDGINNPCPSGFRLPTEAEWDAERLSWETNDYEGAFNSILKLTLGGYRNILDGTKSNVGTGGLYWSSSISTDVQKSDCLIFLLDDAYISDFSRGYGLSVRCIKE